MTTAIQLIEISSLKENPAYARVLADLQSTYGIHELSPAQLHWAEMHANDIPNLYPPSIEADIGEGAPLLSVHLRPIKDGQRVTGDVAYNAPLLLRDVGRWKASRLRDYPIKRWRGVSDSESMFSHPASLSELIVGKVQDTSPVIECIAFLPIASDGSYATEFAPFLHYSQGAHRHWRVGFTVDDGIGAFTHITDGDTREILDVEQVSGKMNTRYINATFMPDLDDFEKLMAPSPAGHMVLIAEPVKNPLDEIKNLILNSLYLGQSLNLDNGGEPDGFNFGSGQTGRGKRLRQDLHSPEYLTKDVAGAKKGPVTVGAVSLSAGSVAGEGSLYEGRLQRAQMQTAIYHIRFLGCKPGTVQAMTAEKLSAMGKGLDSF